jgi:hypothetical protein
MEGRSDGARDVAPWIGGLLAERRGALEAGEGQEAEHRGGDHRVERGAVRQAEDVGRDALIARGGPRDQLTKMKITRSTMSEIEMPSIVSSVRVATRILPPASKAIRAPTAARMKASGTARRDQGRDAHAR